MATPPRKKGFGGAASAVIKSSNVLVAVD